MARSKSHNQLRDLPKEDEDVEPEATAKSFTSFGTGEGSSDPGALQPREQVRTTKCTRHLPAQDVNTDLSACTNKDRPLHVCDAQVRLLSGCLLSQLPCKWLPEA